MILVDTFKGGTRRHYQNPEPVVPLKQKGYLAGRLLEGTDAAGKVSAEELPGLVQGSAKSLFQKPLRKHLRML